VVRRVASPFTGEAPSPVARQVHDPPVALEIVFRTEWGFDGRIWNPLLAGGQVQWLDPSGPEIAYDVQPMRVDAHHPSPDERRADETISLG
jgi:hypothetical protein